MKKNKRKNAQIEKKVKDNEVFDRASRHKLVEVKGKVVEKKYCPSCGRFKTLGYFYSNKLSKDGLSCWCGCCYRKYSHKRLEARRQSENQGSSSQSEKVGNYRDLTIKDINKCLKANNTTLSELLEEIVQLYSSISNKHAQYIMSNDPVYYTRASIK